MKNKCLKYLKLNRASFENNSELLKIFSLNQLRKYFKEDMENEDEDDIFKEFDSIFKDIDLSSFIDNATKNFQDKDRNYIIIKSGALKLKSGHDHLDYIWSNLPYDKCTDWDGDDVDIENDLDADEVEGTLNNIWAYIECQYDLELVFSIGVDNWGDLYFDIKKDLNIYEKISENIFYIPNYGFIYNEEYLKNLLIQWGNSI